VLKNDGSGDYSDRTDCLIGEWPVSVCLGDVNGDNYKDIVTGNRGIRDYEGAVTVLLNDGTGSFPTDATGEKDADERTDYQTFKSIFSVHLGDMNGDGHLDIVTANEEQSGSDTVSVFINNGSGGFEDRFEYPVGACPRSAVLGDIDIDGDLDIITANSEDNTIAVLKNNGTGFFETKIGYAVGDGPFSLGIDDIDGDYDLDIVTGNYGDNTVSVLRNEGGSMFGSRIDYAVGRGPHSINIGDVNGDNDPDIVTLNTIDSSITVLINGGDGDFMLDADGDGYADVIDSFPEDRLEWLDSDDDGFGDNTDDIPWDPLEYMDTDGDYHGDKFDDLFPTDSAQWEDTDGDGFGDNLPGTTVKVRDRFFDVTTGDLFPDDPREWADLDDDMVGDNGDAFPEDITQWKDTDGDGYGDNPPGTIITINGENYTASDETGDRFPNDNNEWSDFDLDGIGNNRDSDDDDDNFLDEWEIYLGTGVKDDANKPRDSDNDSLPDGDTINSQSWMDFDDDNDGYSDMMEANYGSNPLDKSSIPVDWDEDKLPDNIDADDDNDEYPDVTDAFPLDAAASIDSDDDGLPDEFHSWFKEKDGIWNILPEELQNTSLIEDDDDDDDGYLDGNDVFPLDPFEWKDTDGDGYGDNADEDADGDGLKKYDDILFFFDYSDTDDSDPDAGWLIGETIPSSTILSFFKILGGVLLIWMLGVVFRKIRYLQFDAKLSEAKSLKELDKWYHNQIALAMEHGKLDYVGSLQLKTHYEEQKRRLMAGKHTKKKRSAGERIRKSLLFSRKDHVDLFESDKTDEMIENKQIKTEERGTKKKTQEEGQLSPFDNGEEISEQEEGEIEFLDESCDVQSIEDNEGIGNTSLSSESVPPDSPDLPEYELSSDEDDFSPHIDFEDDVLEESSPQDETEINTGPPPTPPPAEES